MIADCNTKLTAHPATTAAPQPDEGLPDGQLACKRAKHVQPGLVNQVAAPPAAPAGDDALQVLASDLKMQLSSRLGGLDSLAAILSRLQQQQQQQQQASSQVVQPEESQQRWAHAFNPEHSTSSVSPMPPQLTPLCNPASRQHDQPPQEHRPLPGAEHDAPEEEADDDDNADDDAVPITCPICRGRGRKSPSR